MGTADYSAKQLLWTALALDGNIGVSRLCTLRRLYPEVETIWRKAAERFEKEPDVRQFLEQGPDLLRAGRELEKWEEKGIRVICVDDPAYPEVLATIPDPPPLLFCMGRKELLEADGMAIVGSRRCTSYGEIVAHQLGAELGKAGYVIISGMAYGIDASAHKGALSVSAATIAVLGCGVDVCYPPQNRKLYQKIRSEGLLLSECLPETEPAAWLFPRRNRLISGLAQGVIVVEGDEKSGSLITADQALEQGRDIYIVPGPIGSRLSRGTNRRIQEGGGMLLVEAADIPAPRKPYHLTLTPPAEKTMAGGTQKEQSILRKLEEKERSQEELLEEGSSVRELLETLTLMELKGLIHRTEGLLWAVGSE